MACIESEHDLDLDGDDFQVVDCWEDEDDDFEALASQEEETSVPKEQQDKSVPQQGGFNDHPTESRKETKPDGQPSDFHVIEASCSKSKGLQEKKDSKASEQKVVKSAKKINSLEKKDNTQALHKDTDRSSISCDALSKENENCHSTKRGTNMNNKTNMKESKQASCIKSNINKKRPEKIQDLTESKVDSFLKEMALQHPQVNYLGSSRSKNDPVDSACKTPGSSLKMDSKKKPNIDLSDLPPGVDLDQVAEDTSTVGLLVATDKKNEARKEAEINSSNPVLEQSNNISNNSKIPALLEIPNTYFESRTTESKDKSTVKSCRIDGRLYADYSKIIPKDKSDWSKSLLRSHQSRLSGLESSMHNAPNRLQSSRGHYSASPSREKRSSRSPSLSLSPSPPRSHHWFAPIAGIDKGPYDAPQDSNMVHRSLKFVQHPRQAEYRSPSTERNYRRRSRESSVLRALSRSLSRERPHHYSRSRSRSKSTEKRRSRSGRRRSHNLENKRRRYASPARSRSPSSRIRSVSSVNSTTSSPDHHRFRRRRSPSPEEDRAKKPRVSSWASRSRSRSRGRSPWKPSIGVKVNERYDPTLRENGSNSLVDDIQLEHDMERFIATNMAATGQLRQPVVEWLETSSEKTFKPLSDPAFELVDQPMPLPPPPPDISELMKSDQRQEDVQVISDHSVSLSSLLESAVSGVPSQAVIDRCQDAIMKLHDVGIKQGRLNIVPSSLEPQQSSSAYFPWQSVLHRPSSDKIQFSYTKPPLNPNLWKAPQGAQVSSEIYSTSTKVSEPSYSVNSDSCAIPNSFELERATLLDKIAFLTKELYEVKQILDLTQVLKISVAVQTEQRSSACPECTKRKEISLQKAPALPLLKASPLMPLSSLSMLSQPTSSATSRGHDSEISSAIQNSSLQLSVYSLPVPEQAGPPSPNPFHLPQSVSTSVPQPVPPPNYPIKGFPSLQSVSFGSSLSTATHTSSFCAGTGNAKESWAPAAPLGSFSSVQAESASPASHLFEQQLPKYGSDWLKGSSTGVSSSKAVAPAPKKNMNVGRGVLDYQLNHHQMVGDEHMFDLVAYLSVKGPQMSVDPKYCSPGQTVEKLLNLFSSKNSFIKSQIIIMIGVYNVYNSSSDAYLKKYAHLVGFLRKRCAHLILIEPPPIPCYVNSLLYWKSVEGLSNLLKSYKTDNVSVVLTQQLFMVSQRTPNSALYVNDKRLSGSGLQVISEELMRVLDQAKAQKKGTPC